MNSIVYLLDELPTCALSAFGNWDIITGSKIYHLRESSSNLVYTDIKKTDA